MSIVLKYLLIAVGGYLMGNISVGILISKAYGIKDIRKRGSGNAGSTNVLRTLGWVPSVLTLIGDCLKALAAAWLGRLIAGDIGLLIGGTFAIIGHDFPVFFRFRGGKGIASSLGLIIMVNPYIALILLVMVLVLARITHYVSVGSIIACICYPLLVALMMRANPYYVAYLLFSVFAALLALFCHRKNIVRLIRSQENRLDFERISRISHKLQNHKK